MKKKQLAALGVIIFALAASCSNPFFPEKKNKGGTTEEEYISSEVPVISVGVTPEGPYIFGEEVTITASAAVNDGGTLSYQWYGGDEDDNTGGEPIPNETGATYTPPTDTAGTVYYYARVTNTLNGKTASAVSDTVKITVYDIGNATAIRNVSLTVTAPIKDGVPAAAATTDDIGYTCTAVTWNPAHNPFQGGVAYTVTVTLAAEENHTFIALRTASINGQAAVTENNGNTLTLSYTFAATDTRTVNSIAVTSQPTKLAYTHGDNLDLAGLVVRLTFDTSETEDIAFASFVSRNISTVPAHGDVLSHTEHNGQSVAVYYGDKTAETDNVTVNPKALTVTGATHTKQYDTTTSANGVTVTLGGIVGDDEVSAASVTAEYTSANAGTNTVNITAVTLTGTAAGNYTVTLPANNIIVTGGITKANPVVTWPTAAAITYGAALSTSALSGGSGTGTFAWTNGAIIPTVTNSGYEVTFTPTDTANYNTLTQTVSLTVNCLISFNTNGGSSIPNQGIAVGGVVSRPANPTRSGYVFDYWYTDAGFTTPYNFSAIVTDNITLYAKWISHADIISDMVGNMVRVEGGSFDMGKNLGTAAGSDATPVHTVTLTGFYMGKYEVTQEQYEAVMGNNPSSFKTGVTAGEVQSKRPVGQVSWYDALVFCNKLSIAEGLTPAYRINNSTDPAAWGTVPTSSDATWNAATIEIGSTGYRLPTEAQWEYAAKGGDPTAAGWVGYTYAGSDTVGDVAWYDSNSESKTHEVGKKAPNRLGLYDMSGNVYEWCWDWYGTYQSGAQTDPVGASSGSFRVKRGGNWYFLAEYYVRSAYRDYDFPDSPDDFYGFIGFRLLRP